MGIFLVVVAIVWFLVLLSIAWEENRRDDKYEEQINHTKVGIPKPKSSRR